MSTLDELQIALHNVLESRGTLNSIRSQLRSDIYHSLQGNSQENESDNTINHTKPQLSNINLMINELIREYLEYNQYAYTKSVLVSESNMTHQAAFTHSFLAQQLKIHESNNPNGRIPLLYSIIAMCMNGEHLVTSIHHNSR
jgi:lisH domain-containing protein FOPNL